MRNCPKCSGRSNVIDTRDLADTVSRRRQCVSSTCGHRWVTHETVKNNIAIDAAQIARELRHFTNEFNRLHKCLRSLESEVVSLVDRVGGVPHDDVDAKAG